jgi:ATP-dependent Clp protease ATP-binding subunit ClpA
VVVLAQEEARLLNHNYIGTEHILLGLIHQGEGVAAKALESSASLSKPCAQVEEIIGGTAPSGPSRSPHAKKVLELSLRKHCSSVTPSAPSTPPGLIREGEGVAAQVSSARRRLSRVRQQVIQLLSGAQTKVRRRAVASPGRQGGSLVLDQFTSTPHSRPKLGPVIRKREGDRARHAVLSRHEEQPRAHRRARRGQDRHREVWPPTSSAARCPRPWSASSSHARPGRWWRAPLPRRLRGRPQKS